MEHARTFAATATTLIVLGVVAAASGDARAAEVRVVDDADKPVANVMVACTRASTGAGLSGPDGIANVPDTCREVYCERGDRVNDLVKIDAGKATCRVRAGVVMTVKAERNMCVDGCWVTIMDADDREPHHGTIDGGVPRRSSHGWLGWRGPEYRGLDRSDGEGRWTSKPVSPGHLLLSVSVGLEDADWYCETDLGALPAGPAQETALWRPPIVVTGVVLDRDGKPVSDVPLFVQPETPAGAGKRAWKCAAMYKNEMPLSGPDGSFRVQIDPAVPVRIEAGWKNYPIGTASATLRGKPDGPIVLRLSAAP